MVLLESVDGPRVYFQMQQEFYLPARFWRGRKSGMCIHVSALRVVWLGCDVVVFMAID